MKGPLKFAAALSLAGACVFAHAQGAAPQKPTLAISGVEATPALAMKIKRDGKQNEFERIAQSLNEEIAAAMQGANRYQIVARGDFSKLLAEQDFAQSGNVDASDPAAAQPGKLKGAANLLVVTVTDFQDYSEKASFETLGRDAEKRVIRLGLVAKRYDASTGALFNSFSCSLSNIDAQEILANVRRNGNSNDSLVPEISKLMAKRVADGFAASVFPIRVLSVFNDNISINRGEGSEVGVGDELDIYAQGGRLIDPDTGEDLGIDEIFIGKAKIIRVTPKFSQAKLLMDNGVDVGNIARKAAQTE